MAFLLQQIMVLGSVQNAHYRCTEVLTLVNFRPRHIKIITSEQRPLIEVKISGKMCND